MQSVTALKNIKTLTLRSLHALCLHMFEITVVIYAI
jgi:hypothetical protein